MAPVDMEALLRRQRIRKTPSITERLNPLMPEQQDSTDPLSQLLAQQQQPDEGARFVGRQALQVSPFDATNPLKALAFSKGSVISPYQHQMGGIEDIAQQTDYFRQLQAQANAAIAQQGQSGSGFQIPQGTDIGSKIVAAAEKWLGTPYSWGGGSLKGPTRGIKQGANTVGFDCSGLVRYAYAQVGLKMPRVSYGQLKMGHKAALNSLRPGDLVGFGNGHHIGIYIGGGKFIEAPHTGAKVRISNLKDRRDAWGVKIIA